jgi:biofilm PGA synthesis N-glycosyltransferase PgaC
MMLEHAQAVVDALQRFEFVYPFVMAGVWIAGALFFWWFEERDLVGSTGPPPVASGSRAAVIVPCHNEAPQVRDTIRALTELRYPDYEIIAVDDGSTDRTGAILEDLATDEPRLRVLRLPVNRGKAAALHAGVQLTDAEYVICVDGDALLEEDALAWMVRALASADDVGGVTGNPRIRTRSTALGRLQIGEFSTLVGLIKRAQMVMGHLFTVSGVVCGFRRRALAEVGYWRTDVLTEDVDVTWRLQLAGWRVRFEPRALCWILTPETLRGLWRQRLRWATGAFQVLLGCLPQLLRWRSRGMWVIVGEYLVSVVWAFVAVALTAIWAVGLLPGVALPVSVGGLVPREWGLTLGAMFLVQVAVGMALDRRYEPGVERYLSSVIGYPFAFWIFTALTVVVGVPWALARRRGRQAVWVSPDRGLRSIP